jgi:hypothetical protein
LWADPKDGTVFAVQVKTDSHATELTVLSTSTGDGGKGSDSAGQYDDDMKAMARYLKDKVILKSARSVHPLLVIVPAGDSNEHALYNQTTGQPTKEMVEKLYDAIDREVFSKEEY